MPSKKQRRFKQQRTTSTRALDRLLLIPTAALEGKQGSKPDSGGGEPKMRTRKTRPKPQKYELSKACGSWFEGASTCCRKRAVLSLRSLLHASARWRSPPPRSVTCHGPHLPSCAPPYRARNVQHKWRNAKKKTTENALWSTAPPPPRFTSCAAFLPNALDGGEKPEGLAHSPLERAWGVRASVARVTSPPPRAS